MEDKNKSFSLGRLDIVDLYEWKGNGKLVYQTYFQRQFVWREKDKVELIDTIMKGLPIPSIFICDAGTDFDSLSKRYNVLDGRQRLESIFEFLENKYQYNGSFFKDFASSEKKKILNYNIVLIQMYIEPDDTEKIKEIFKRLNKNAYNLNKMEKQSTQLVEYDYMIIAKIASGIVQFEKIEEYLEEIQELFEPDENSEEEAVEITDYEDETDNISDDIKRICKWDNIQYIHKMLTGDTVFSPYDRRRQVSLQYFLNVFTCIMKREMINRNVPEKVIIQLSDEPKELIGARLVDCNNACKTLISLYEDIDEFWRNKTSFFTLCYVLSTNAIDRPVNEIKTILEDFQNSKSSEWIQYYEASNQGVNDKRVRDIRVQLLEKILI